MKLTFPRQFTLLFGLLLGLLAALVGLGALSAGQLRDSLAVVDHTRETQRLLLQVRDALDEAELAQRAGERGRSEMARERLDAALTSLSAIDAIHPERHALHERLGLHIAGQAFDRAREVLETLADDEAHRLLEGRREGARSMEDALRVGSVLALFAAVLLAVSYVLVRHELARREQARRAQDAARDVLEQRVAERTAALQQALASLAQSQARLEGIIGSATDAILTVDAAQTIVMANAAAASLLGAEPAQIVGAPLERFVPAAQRERHRTEVARFGASGQSARAMGGGREVMALRVDGREVPVDATISQLQIDGQPLYTAILRDCSERRRAQNALRDSEARLRRLVDNQEQVREGERVRIARELHDDLQQTLAAIKLDLVSAAALARQQSPQLGPLLATLDELVGNAIVSTRRIVNDLRPQLLDDLGLVAALRSLATQFEQRNGIAVRVRVVGLDEDEVLPAGVSICLYRVAQEALHNVAKHARAHHVELRLARGSAGRLRLRVRDDGQGLMADAASRPQSFGLMGMRERVRALHGELRVTGHAGEGTTVEATLPRVPDTVPSPALP